MPVGELAFLSIWICILRNNRYELGRCLFRYDTLHHAVAGMDLLTARGKKRPR
jgi:hypothetical protein